MNIIDTIGLVRRYGRTEALHGLDLAVPEGSVTALLGPNGAGKTTTIKVLLNLLRPTAGSARVMGVESTRLGPREFAQIGYVSENQQLPLWMTVRELLDYCRPFYPTWDRDLERRLLTSFALPEERRLSQLSRGMLMKAALLSALAYRPRLVVLDEPFSGLDPLVREEFTRGLLEVPEAGEWTMLISSHDIEEVERLCDRVALMSAGRLRLNESTESLQTRFRRVEVNLQGGAARLDTVPPGWLGMQREGERVSFVATDFAEGETEARCRDRFPEAAVTAHPMTLREIFVALARAEKTNLRGVAA